MKILNLYAGIGGNRKLWTNCEVTAIEMNPDIAKIYQDFFPDDKVIVADAHDYLLKNHAAFDFIWSSPPCQSHSQFAKLRAQNDDIKSGNHLSKPKYIDMTLYQEIIFLDSYFSGHYVVENVVPYYEPLIKPKKLGRHLFWANFHIYSQDSSKSKTHFDDLESCQMITGFDLSKHKIGNKRQILRNCVNPELGLHIFNCIPSIKDESNFQQPELLFN